MCSQSVATCVCASYCRKCLARLLVVDILISAVHSMFVTLWAFLLTLGNCPHVGYCIMVWSWLYVAVTAAV